MGVKASEQGAAAFRTRAKPLFFREKLNFLGQKSAVRNEKNIFYIY